MRTCLKLCVLTLACLMVFGCAAKKRERQEDDSLWAEQGESVPYSESDAERRFRRSFEMAMDEADDEGDFATAGGRKGLAPLRANRPEINTRLLRRARSAIGTPYVSGGMAPGGFDCSGLVCWAYKSVGVKLPRTAREQSVVGRRITNARACASIPWTTPISRAPFWEPAASTWTGRKTLWPRLKAA